jgi:epoxyqueuosine reductase
VTSFAPSNDDDNVERSPFDAVALVAALRLEASSLGFARVGISAAGSPPHHEAFQGWLAAGLAGVMQPWLARHEPLRSNPDAILPGAHSVVMLATHYSAGLGPAAEPLAAGHGRVARYARGDDYHDLLRKRLNILAAWIEVQVPGARARGVVDSAPLAERDFARLAGLGWFGKNTMLIDPRAGSYFFLSGIVTDVALPVDRPLDVDHCGTCTACLDACPTGAFPAPRVLDASKCISAITIEDHGVVPDALRPGVGDWIFGCDICQEVCPWNRHAPGTDEPSLQPRDGQVSLDLAELLALDDEGFRKRFRGSPLLRAKRRGLLRSAAIALGNRPHVPSFEALVAALADAEPVVRGAAAWAIGRWIEAKVMAKEAGRSLETRRAIETDAAVTSEIVNALNILPGYEHSISSMSDDGSRPGPSIV